jgi:hypothetical protein
VRSFVSLLSFRIFVAPGGVVVFVGFFRPRRRRRSRALRLVAPRLLSVRDGALGAANPPHLTTTAMTMIHGKKKKKKKKKKKRYFRIGSKRFYFCENKLFSSESTQAKESP